MKIVITGGTGFIGKSLISNFYERKHNIIVFSRDPEKYMAHFPANIKFVKWNFTADDNLIHALDGSDAVINLAGENIAGDNIIQMIIYRWSSAKKQRLYKSRIDTGRVLVDALTKLKRKPSVFIQASAVGIYGDRGDEILTEDSQTGNDFFANLCRDWEASTRVVVEMGIRHVIIRSPGCVLSSRGGSLPYMTVPYKFYIGGPIGNGKQWFSWVHIHDEIKAINYLLANSDLKGVFNLSSPGIVINKEFEKNLAKVLGKPYYLPLPNFILNLLFGEKSKLLTSSQRQIPKRLLDAGFEFSFPDLSDALLDLYTHHI